MKDFRKMFRWILLIAGIVWGLLQLNGAVFAAWVAGGPPSTNPDGWLFVAGNRLAWAASFLASAGLFVLLRRGRPPSRYAVVALAAAALLTAFPYIREFIASDACLDSGGRWSHLRCVHSDPPAA